MSNKEKNFFRYIGKYLNNDGKIDKLSIRDLVIQFYNRNFKDYTLPELYKYLNDWNFYSDGEFDYSKMPMEYLCLLPQRIFKKVYGTV